nr:MAG TPA: hypothetical protein [Microviridae sp.]
MTKKDSSGLQSVVKRLIFHLKSIVEESVFSFISDIVYVIIDVVVLVFLIFEMFGVL